MRTLLLRVLLALSLLLPLACQRTESRVKEVAETFLNAYYTADYDRAAQCCTPALAALVSKGAQARSPVPAEVAEKMKEAVRQTSFNIVFVEVDPDVAAARVRYDLTVPGLDKPVPKTLHLQLEGRTARVDRIE